KRPKHRAARRLLATGVIYTTDLALGRALTVLAAAYGVVPWFWLGNALVLALDNMMFCTIIALLAVFPDGAYQRPYEHWIVRASWVFVPAVPLLLLLTHPVLYYNIYEIVPGPNAASASPLYIPALAPFAPLALALYQAPFGFILVGAGLLALRYRRAG